jgi:hypothetical protein
MNSRGASRYAASIVSRMPAIASGLFGGDRYSIDFHRL